MIGARGDVFPEPYTRILGRFLDKVPPRPFSQIKAALERGWWPVAVLVLLSSLLAVVYVWRFVEIAYFNKPEEDAPDIKEAPLSMLIPTCVMIGVTIYFGLQTEFSAEVAGEAARSLLGAGR